MPEKGLSVLILADAFPRESETFVVDHVRALLRAGYLVTVAAREIGSPVGLWASEFPEQLRLVSLPAAGFSGRLRAAMWVLTRPWAWGNWFVARCALHGMRIREVFPLRGKWHYVHAHFGNNAVAALIGRPEWRDCLGVNFHGHDATAVPKRFGWRAYRRVLGSIPAVVHSDFMEARLRRHTDLNVLRVVMGVDPRRFFPRPRGASWPECLRLLSVGRLVEHKGHARAIETLAWLRRFGGPLDARLTIVGSGPERERLLKLARTLRVESHNDGPLSLDYDTMPEVYRSADILLALSQVAPDGWEEAFSRSAVEAMACGIPVIAASSGGLPATVEDGGSIVADTEADTVGSAVKALIAQGSPQAWEKKACRRAAVFTLDRMDEDYLGLVRRFVKGCG